MKVSLKALFAETWDALPADRLELKEILKVLGCLPETLVARRALLRWLVDCPPDALGLRTPDECFEDGLGELRARNLLERPNPDHVRLHPLVHDYVKGQARHGFRVALLIRAADRLRGVDYLARADPDELLALLRELPMLEGLADEHG